MKPGDTIERWAVLNRFGDHVATKGLEVNARVLAKQYDGTRPDDAPHTPVRLVGTVPEPEPEKVEWRWRINESQVVVIEAPHPDSIEANAMCLLFGSETLLGELAGLECTPHPRDHWKTPFPMDDDIFIAEPGKWRILRVEDA